MRILPWTADSGKAGVQVLVVGNTNTTCTIFAACAAEVTGLPTPDFPDRGTDVTRLSNPDFLDRGAEVTRISNPDFLDRGAEVTRISTADVLDRRADAALGLRQDLDTVFISVMSRGEDRHLTEALPRGAFLLGEDAPIEIDYDPPGSLGADRIANALAARELHGAPVLAIDCGTATTMTLVDSQGRLVGGAIAPGLTPCLEAVRDHTPRLPRFPVEWPPSPLGRSTIESLQVGVVRGHAAMIRALAADMAPGVPIVMTGGWSGLLAERVPGAARHGNLTAWGGKVYWESCIRRTHQGG